MNADNIAATPTPTTTATSRSGEAHDRRHKASLTDAVATAAATELAVQLRGNRVRRCEPREQSETAETEHEFAYELSPPTEAPPDVGGRAVCRLDLLHGP